MNRPRELVRERVRQYRLRQRAECASRSQTTTVQHEQGEEIVNLTTVEEEEATATSLFIGMRNSPDVRIPHDPAAAQLLQSAEEMDEHKTLYIERFQPTNRPVSG